MQNCVIRDVIMTFSGHELHSLHQAQLKDGGPLVRGRSHPRATALLRNDVSAGSHAAGLPLANRLRRAVQHVQELHACRHCAAGSATLLQG